MRIGLLIPQGYFGEFDGWEPARAWERVLAIAERGRRLGFGSLWTGEHVLSKWDPRSLAFECATLSTAIAARVPDVEIGFVVLNSTFRNPVLTAKFAGTLDAISGGRLILGLGAGFKPNEAEAMGVRFPATAERLAVLTEHFEILSRLTRAGGGAVDFEGRHARAKGAVNEPAVAGRDHVPLLIGGHGRNVTFRLAARYCDEINVDHMPPEMPEALAVLADRCAEVGRDPATLTVAATIGPAWPYVGLRVTGRQRMMVQSDIPAIMEANVSGVGTRTEEMIAWRELGIGRLVVGAPGMVDTDEAMDQLVEDLTEAGLALTPRG
ncbi:MAG TPA: LLM class flavin-dependent oxidoreductase [Candidatus Limnocylindrales bacterium]|nr:LLM class flavin-dependent oxidoreductase [Candidatus Limnocylindrales bacterium]